MFCDETTIKITAGRGGDGAVTFRREKFVSNGGPDGGDGGKGGNITIKANENITTLSDLNSRKHHKAENGENGRKKNMTGKAGPNLTIEVPTGTIIWNPDKTEVLADLSEHEKEFIAAKGGKGGLGNQHFASSTNQAPNFAESGEPGEEKGILLELKLVADAGLVGMPSVGKSTLISHISNARPKIAAYEFTTLIPNLGVVDMKRFGGDSKDSFVVADIPGLIEGASKGKGLGHKFLRHIARTKILVHIIDPLRPNPVETFKKIQRELNEFDKSLTKKPLIIAINKIDAVSPKDVEKVIKKLKEIAPQSSKKIFTISAVSGENLAPLLFEILKTIKAQPKRTKKKTSQTAKIPTLSPHKHLIKFKIEKIEKQKNNKTFTVTGQRIEQIVTMTDFSNLEGLERIYHFLSKMGILRALRKEKADLGDIIEIAGKHIPYRE